MKDELRSRFRGALLGLALGDAIGAPFEGAPPAREKGTRKPKCDMPLRYTDDTEMMIGLSESILEEGSVVPETVVQWFIREMNPWRGYGIGTLRVLELVKEGVKIEKATRAVFPEGSFGNGAAMRVAPIGLVWAADLLRVMKEAEKSSITTHTHPLGIEGARMIALSVAIILRTGSKEGLLDELSKMVREEVFLKKLLVAKEFLKSEPTLEEIVQKLGNGVLAVKSVVTAIYAFLRFGDSFIDTINFCLDLGGDTDTIGAMAGALTGVYLGETALPTNCLANLEGYERLLDLSDALLRLSLS